jgi:5-methylcytosine-specific restriction endonuclease McrA
MDWKVLLLGPDYVPVEVVHWTKAIELLMTGKAEIVEEYDGIPIRSERLSFNLPSILRLIKSYTRRKHVKFSRANIFYRDNYRCLYCGVKKGSDELTFDHVVPKCRRTDDSHKSWTNIVTACIPCNRKKAGRTPQEAGMRLLKEPVKPSWTPAMTIRLKATDPDSWRSYCYWNLELEPG